MLNRDKIRKLIEESGMSNERFFEESGIKKSWYQKSINGNSEPGVYKLETIADYFGVPLDYFFDREQKVQIGHNVNGDGNNVGDISILMNEGVIEKEQSISEFKKENDLLNRILQEKERIIEEKQRVIDEKERMINILLKQSKE